jgi:Mrp family chromosome partitioning ATPase
MGRILEALSKGGTQCQPTDDPALALPAHPAQSGSDSAEDIVEKMPFIEVGGPRKIIDASPDVLACPTPGPRVSTVLPVDAPPTTPPAPGAPVAAEPGLKSVRFRPLSPDQLLLPPAQGRFAPELVAFHQPEHPLSEGYRSLLGSIRTQLTHDRPNVLMFTAPSARAGTTTVLLNIAITAARQAEGRVIVVDANRCRPDMARRLGLPAAPGLREVLTGSASLLPTVQETGQENLCALTAGKASEDGSVRLVVEAMPMVLRLLREQFQLVLVDTPSWDGGPEAAALTSTCDAAYLVMEQTRAETPEATELLRRLRHEGSSVCGCILTQW